MDLPLPPKTFTSLFSAILRVDLLKSPDSPPCLPWEDLCTQLFAGLDASRCLRFTQGLQRALARAAHEQWSASQLEAYLLSGQLEGGLAAAAGAAWGREREGVLAAVAARGFAPLPALQGAPSFAIATLTASSEGAAGGEPVAVLHLHTAEGPLTLEAGRGALGAAVAALGAARRAIGAL